MHASGLGHLAAQLPTPCLSSRQLRAFVNTVYFPASGPVPLKMTDNFRPPQPLRSRKVFASRDATSSRGCPCHLLSPLLLLALLSPLSPSP